MDFKPACQKTLRNIYLMGSAVESNSDHRQINKT